MEKLLIAVLFIVVFSFALVFSFDKKLTKKTRIVLMITSLICAGFSLFMIYLIMKSPY